MDSFGLKNLFMDFLKEMHLIVQPKNNACTRSGTRSSCAARTRKRWKEVKLRFIRKKFQTQEDQNPIWKKPQEVTSPTANRKYPQEVYSSWLNQQYTDLELCKRQTWTAKCNFEFAPFSLKKRQKHLHLFRTMQTIWLHYENGLKAEGKSSIFAIRCFARLFSVFEISRHVCMLHIFAESWACSLSTAWTLRPSSDAVLHMSRI